MDTLNDIVSPGNPFVRTSDSGHSFCLQPNIL